MECVSHGLIPYSSSLHNSSECFLECTVQSNPIFIVKTQLTERSGITDKHRENHILKKPSTADLTG